MSSDEIAAWPEAFRVAVEAAIRAEAEAIERACEAAVQDGRYGVMVIRNRDHRLVSALPDGRVPYGYIYEQVAETKGTDDGR